jgi:hypothetical protein
MKQFNSIELDTNPKEYYLHALKGYYPQLMNLKKKVNDPYYNNLFEILEGLNLIAKNDAHTPKKLDEFLEFMENKK